MILVRTDRPCLRVGCHIRLHFPGVVTLLGNGRRVVATIWTTTRMLRMETTGLVREQCHMTSG
jgi:hypothetical protein